ncbi:MAG: uroporphyrinogen decarboxylase family protein [Kiritimatiellae bacterium]|nr:uroporphyrinogen decarboxylase family protein [Kiritimatiellia bacterium]
MAYKGVLDDIRKCVNLEKPGRIPVFACSEEFDVRVCGTTYEAYCQDPEKMAACQIAAVETFDYDWAWLQVDDCIEFEVLGVGTKGAGNILRATYGYLPATAETLNGLKMPDPHKDGRMPVLLEAIAKVKARFGDSVCVTGRTAAPFSSVGLLYGMQETLLLPYTDADLLKETMAFFVELQTAFGKAQIEAGADAIWFGDCNASSHLISPEQYKAFAFGPAKAVSDAYKAAGGLVFYHASEEGASLPAMTELGVSALSVGPGIELGTALSVTAGKVCGLGNLDPIGVLQNGSVEQVRQETIRLMGEAKKAGAHLFNSGEMIPRETPEANMRAMVETAREHGSFS